MKEKLKELLNYSYSPYSKYRVAAVALMKDGREFTGVNIENASFGATICAERTAISKAISEGYKKGDFKELYVMCDDEKIGTCCFICRQVITEFFEEDALITMMNPDGESLVLKVKELCPYPFNEENLK